MCKQGNISPTASAQIQRHTLMTQCLPRQASWTQYMQSTCWLDQLWASQSAQGFGSAGIHHCQSPQDKVLPLHSSKTPQSEQLWAPLTLGQGEDTQRCPQAL